MEGTFSRQLMWLIARYGIALGDSLSGAGTVGAWSGAYFLINRRRIWMHGTRLLPLLATGLITQLAAFNAILYGSSYFLDSDTARRS